MTPTRPRPARRIGAALVVLVALSAPVAAGGQARIAGLDDLSLGRWSGRGALTADDWHCVRVPAGRALGTFRLEAFGDGPGGAFVLRSGNARIPFRLAYDDGGGMRALPGPRRSLGGLAGSRTGRDFLRCLGGDATERRRLRVEVAEEVLAAAPAGRFRGTLTLLLLPE